MGYSDPSRELLARLVEGEPIDWDQAEAAATYALTLLATPGTTGNHEALGLGAAAWACSRSGLPTPPALRRAIRLHLASQVRGGIMGGEIGSPTYTRYWVAAAGAILAAPLERRTVEEGDREQLRLSLVWHRDLARFIGPLRADDGRWRAACCRAQAGEALDAYAVGFQLLGPPAGRLYRPLERAMRRPAWWRPRRGGRRLNWPRIGAAVLGFADRLLRDRGMPGGLRRVASSLGSRVPPTAHPTCTLVDERRILHAAHLGHCAEHPRWMVVTDRRTGALVESLEAPSSWRDGPAPTLPPGSLDARVPSGSWVHPKASDLAPDGAAWRLAGELVK